MPINNMQLLEAKYRGRLEQKANQYIHFAVDGARRMQKLIEALLKYSRIIRGEFSWVDTNSTFSDAVANLDTTIKENGADIKIGRAHG